MAEQWTDLTVVRHGLTNWNAAGRFQGFLDVPLSETGRKQSRRLASRLAGSSFDVVYSSDLRRALETAAPTVRQLGMTIRHDPGLREWNLGEFQNMTRAEARTRFEKEFHAYCYLEPDLVIPGGESYREFYQRSMASLETIARAHSGQRVLIFSHGGVIVNLIRQTRSIPMHQNDAFSIPNTGMVSVSVKLGAILCWEKVNADFKIEKLKRNKER